VFHPWLIPPQIETTSTTVDTHELSANLPPLRDDEPPSLRQDILDELADHLRCALRREMLTQDDEAAARKRVLDKFGDPREVARKLWVQAMWSRIMSQRITLGLLTLATAACLVLAGLMWQTTRQNQQANAALLEQMAKLIEASRTPVPVPPTPDTTLTVRLFNGEKDGQPPKTGTVEVYGTELHNASVKGNRRLNSSGLIEFGILPHGTYNLSVRTARGRTNRSVKVLRGEPHVDEFICPDEELRKDDIQIECDLPEDLKEKDVVTFAYFNPEPFEFKGDNWHFDSGANFGVLVSQLGQLFNEEISSSVVNFQQNDFQQNDFQQKPFSESNNRQRWITDLINSGRSPPFELKKNRQHWTGDHFKLTRLALVTNPQRFNLRTPIANRPPVGDRSSNNSLPVVAARMKKGDADWPAELDADYVVKEGQPWRITIPDRLTEEARKQITETPAAKPGSP
jgi:hypothetical protein